MVVLFNDSIQIDSSVSLLHFVHVKETNELQCILKKELDKLKAKLWLTLDIKVVWMPDKTASLAGEVKDGSIYIYELDEEKAVQTLKHELVDYLITSRIVKPLVNLLNILIKAREAEIYKEKEKIVEIFSKII